MFCSLLTGAALAIPSTAEHDNVPALLDFVDEMGVTIVDGFPYLIADFNASGRVPKGVRLYISGGDVLRANYCDQLVDRAEVYNTYGPSETTCCATYYRASAGAPLADGTYPVGRAVLGYRVDILNDDLQPVDRGQVGEICVTGAGVSRGYLTQRPESSNFVMQDDGSRMYRTGDLGVMTDTGDIAFLRRKDSQVMSEGKRVECTEVENVLSADDSVDRAVVRDHSDENGLSYLVAYLTPASQGIVLSELRERLARRLTSFMIPEFFVVMNEIPLNSNGKPDDAAPTRLERANRAYYERELPTGGHIACLARLDGEPVGCGGVCLHTEMPSPDNPSGHCAYLMNVYTRPAFQGRGVGAAVVDWLIRQARARGVDKVYLEASDAGRRLYESTGFTDMADMMRLTQGGRTRPA
ncbi:GNAT family N-acetyltransferase [Actinomyces sp.]|uniref:GNAT family N-acetyltransferase n=1 Tax=Actinomyces sp. TaxID=29317 RepID=UPI0026DDA2B2|nr:GNAT family N-acetyltransferase [Actinomyces sp.]MDO4900328.1 GNAT family N-acetyltransferase [Actinomyces sp.]